MATQLSIMASFAQFLPHFTYTQYTRTQVPGLLVYSSAKEETILHKGSLFPFFHYFWWWPQHHQCWRSLWNVQQWNVLQPLAPQNNLFFDAHPSIRKVKTVRCELEKESGCPFPLYKTALIRSNVTCRMLCVSNVPTSLHSLPGHTSTRPRGDWASGLIEILSKKHSFCVVALSSVVLSPFGVPAYWTNRKWK